MSIATSMKSGLALLDEQLYDLAVFDLDLEERFAGFKLVAKAKRLGLYNIILSANESNDIVKEGYILGCMDYLAKPISSKACDLVFQKFFLINNTQKVEEMIQERFISVDPQTIDMLEIIKRINLSEKTVLITGESGTGKTCLAQIIHDVTKGPDRPFISLNCSQFNDLTIDSELFGHVKGAFTGAIKDKMGLIEKSKGGTLFLDEVHSLSARAQQKLLKTLDDGIIYPMGSERPKSVKFRVICASCEQLEGLMAAGKFRQDLYFRIKTFELHLRPLRERKVDILLLLQFYINKGERKMVLSSEVEKALINYHWPANTREIEDLVENWNMQSVGIVQLENLPARMRAPAASLADAEFFTGEQCRMLNELGLKEFTNLIKKTAITKTLKEKNGKQVEAARKLKMSKSALSKALDKMQGGQDERRVL